MQRYALVLLVAVGAGASSRAAAQVPVGAAGDGLLYIGTYAQAIFVISEAEERVLHRIPLEAGIPRSLVLGPDESRFYVMDITHEHVEVVDIADRRAVDHFTLSRGNEKVWIYDLAVAPSEEYALLLVRSYTKLIDRYEVGPVRLLQVDLESHEVLRELPLPMEGDGAHTRVRFSSDGRSLYFFGDDIKVYETEGFTEVGHWAYEDALSSEGLDGFGFRFTFSRYDEPGHVTGLFRTRDPLQDRRLMGVAEVDLVERAVVDFFLLGPAESVDFVLAPDGQTAYGLHEEVGNYQFWTFDLKERRVASRERFPGRPRMDVAVSSSGRILYVYNAGNTIDLYEADTYRYLRTIDLGADTTTDLFVLPAPPTVTAVAEERPPE